MKTEIYIATHKDYSFPQIAGYIPIHVGKDLTDLKAKHKKTVAPLMLDKQEKELAIKYGISSIPTLVIFKDGKIAKTLIGFRPKEEIKEVLNNI